MTDCQNRLARMGTRGKLVEFCPKCGKRYVGDESKAGTRVKCQKLACGHTFLLPGYRTAGPIPRPRPKPKTSALKTVLVSLISLLTIGSIVLGTVLLIKKNKNTPPKPLEPKPPGPFVKPTGGGGQVDQKTLANMVGKVVSAVKIHNPGKPAIEWPGIGFKMSLAEAKTLSEEEGKAMCRPIIDDATKKIVSLKYGIGNSGSCFLITPDGYAITNQHVTKAAYYAQNNPVVITRLKNKSFLADPAYGGASLSAQFWVFLDGTAHEATVVFQHDKFDFSILKIDGISGAPFFKLSEKRKPDDLVLKTQVVTLGFPGSSTMAVTTEIGKAEEEKLKKQQGSKIKSHYLEENLKFVLKEGVVSVVKPKADGSIIIEHDANINKGNSGGPLVSSAGLNKPQENAVVYGINTWVLRSTSVSLSLMMETARKDIERHVPNAVWVDK